MAWLDDEMGNVFSTFGSAPPPDQDIVIYKYPSGSLRFPSSGIKAIRAADNPDFALGSGSFCIDFWIYPDTLPSMEDVRTFCGHGRLGGVAPNMARWEFSCVGDPFGGFTQGLYFSSYDGSDTLVYTIGSTADAGLTLSNWQHLALCAEKSGGNLIFRFFKGGIQVGADITVVSVPISDPGGLFCVGTSGPLPAPYNNMKCRIDEFRFSVGTPRWTSGFVPPTAPYSVDAYTKVLMHYGAPSAPTTDQIMRCEKWFSGGVFQGYYLGVPPVPVP